MFPVAILAGGRATRLRPITENIPKALIEIAGRPFINRQLELLRSQGVTRVVLCTGYLSEQIESVVGDGRSFGIDVHYSTDGPTLRGTGGALRQALPWLGDQFFVLYGDSYLLCNFRQVHQAFVEANRPALMTVMKNHDRWDKSNVFLHDGHILEYNKYSRRPEMEYIDYGLGILSAGVLETYPPDQSFDLAAVYHQLSLDGKLAAYEVYDRFYEIGSIEGIKEAEIYFSTKETA